MRPCYDERTPLANVMEVGREESVRQFEACSQSVAKKDRQATRPGPGILKAAFQVPLTPAIHWPSFLWRSLGFCGSDWSDWRRIARRGGRFLQGSGSRS